MVASDHKPEPPAAAGGWGRTRLRPFLPAAPAAGSDCLASCVIGEKTWNPH